jgi:hypothetical protein
LSKSLNTHEPEEITTSGRYFALKGGIQRLSFEIASPKTLCGNSLNISNNSQHARYILGNLYDFNPYADSAHKDKRVRNRPLGAW